MQNNPARIGKHLLPIGFIEKIKMHIRSSEPSLLNKMGPWKCQRLQHIYRGQRNAAMKVRGRVQIIPEE